ncbi:DUF4907 domain-containing protein [Flagellimonas allohymeniacidonis]|nr:DUF4907 domain-containing protein [Allomuricauda hymeniacidonis]
MIDLKEKYKMEKTQKVILSMGIALCLTVGILLFLHMTRHAPYEDGLRLEVKGSYNTGWQYVIYHHKKVLIYQKSIPVVAGSGAFVTKEDAQNIGNLVLAKIRKNELPVIQKTDLERFNVQIPEKDSVFLRAKAQL